MPWHLTVSVDVRCLQILHIKYDNGFRAMLSYLRGLPWGPGNPLGGAGGTLQGKLHWPFS